MKAVAAFLAFIAVILFINSPVETAGRASESFGISPLGAIGLAAIGGLILMIFKSRRPR